VLQRGVRGGGAREAKTFRGHVLKASGGKQGDQGLASGGGSRQKRKKKRRGSLFQVGRKIKGNNKKKPGRRRGSHMSTCKAGGKEGYTPWGDRQWEGPTLGNACTENLYSKRFKSMDRDTNYLSNRMQKNTSCGGGGLQKKKKKKISSKIASKRGRKTADQGAGGKKKKENTEGILPHRTDREGSLTPEFSHAREKKTKKRKNKNKGGGEGGTCPYFGKVGGNQQPL